MAEVVQLISIAEKPKQQEIAKVVEISINPCKLLFSLHKFFKNNHCIV
jgi:hypothetical protein